VKRARLIWAYRRSARPYIFLGVLCILAGVGGLLDPEALGQSTLARELGPPAQKVWLGCYALGGVLLLAGTMWPRRAREEWETAGLCLVLGGMAINAMIVLALRGPLTGGTTLLSILFASWMIQGRLQELRERATFDAWDRRRRRSRQDIPPASGSK
jgi:hypothetical protein